MIRRILALALLAVTVAVLTGCGSTTRMTIAGPSMEPAYANGDKVNVDKKAYASAQPQRGDVIAFKDANGNTAIKRVVGLPGETVEIKDKKVYIDGSELKESYLNEPDSTESAPDTQWTVQDKSVFVLGDNRTSSKDSRGYGSVGYDKIIGKVVK